MGIVKTRKSRVSQKIFFISKMVQDYGNRTADTFLAMAELGRWGILFLCGIFYLYGVNRIGPSKSLSWGSLLFWSWVDEKKLTELVPRSAFDSEADRSRFDALKSKQRSMTDDLMWDPVCFTLHLSCYKHSQEVCGKVERLLFHKLSVSHILALDMIHKNGQVALCFHQLQIAPLVQDVQAYCVIPFTKMFLFEPKRDIFHLGWVLPSSILFTFDGAYLY